MTKSVTSGIFFILFLTLWGAPGRGILSASERKIRFVALGDAPYIPADVGKFDRLIQAVNQRGPDFVVHIGDIKGGATPCSDETLKKVYDQFNAFKVPLIYTPGDNEWTDCHRSPIPPNNPLERLDYLRKLFFSAPTTLGSGPVFPLDRQGDRVADTSSPIKKYVENQRWMKGQVQFNTLHIVGSNNNLQEDPAARAEYEERNSANLIWIESAFAEAREKNLKALVFFMQADPLFEGKDEQRTGFVDTLKVFKKAASSFSFPILLVHGDSHRFMIDHPLEFTHFMRLEVYGFPHVGGIEVTVDGDSPQPFTFFPLPL